MAQNIIGKLSELVEDGGNPDKRDGGEVCSDWHGSLMAEITNHAGD